MTRIRLSTPIPRRRNRCALLLLLAVSAPLFAQTSEQLRQLEQLTPAQRAAILEALDAPTGEQQAPLTQPPVVVPEATEPAPPPPTAGPASERPGLQPFGYDLFAGAPTTFAPATDIPVPVDYVIGPGDTVELQLFGNQNAQYSLVVGRDGVLNVPELGPITGGGYANAATRKWVRAYVEKYGRLPDEARRSWPYPFLADLLGTVRPLTSQVEMFA